MNRYPVGTKENAPMQVRRRPVGALVTGPPPPFPSPLLQSMCLHTGRKMPSLPPSS